MRELTLFNDQVRAIDRMFSRGLSELGMRPMVMADLMFSNMRGHSIPEDGSYITTEQTIKRRLQCKHVYDDDGNFVKAELLPVEDEQTADK
jgi:cytosine/adenosine deaminase-related metal-dependent hydrolase|tara:strand:- start:2459 stop:2731 length:273 start_codon:yes stop_codon:yes gene_type:complete